MGLKLSKYNFSRKINQNYTLINNTLTGAVDIIENRIWDSVRDPAHIGSNPLSSLMERGYLYYDLKEEEKLFKKIFNSYLKKAKSRPIRYVFCPTYQCNLNCSYCFEKALPQKSMDTKMLERAIKAAEIISENHSNRMEAVELFGGEPLLLKCKLLVEKILEFAASKDTIITIVTNGVKVHRFIDILKPYRENIEMLQITIDGPSQIHDKRRKYRTGRGSFSEIVNSIRLLLENRININVRVNIDKSNIESLPDLYHFIDRQGWLKHPNFSIRLAEVTDHSSTECAGNLIEPEKLLKKLIKVYREHPYLEDLFGYYIFKPLRHLLDILGGAPNVSPKFFNCESNLLELNIFCPDGLIYVCGESIGNPDMAIGRFDPSLEFFGDKKSLWIGRNVLTLEECRNCKFGPICGGGCMYSSILVHGDCRKPVCERYKEVLDTYIDYKGSEILNTFLSN